MKNFLGSLVAFGAIPFGDRLSLSVIADVGG